MTEQSSHAPIFRAKGETVDYVVTYLEMYDRPGFDHPSVPPGPPSALIHAQNPPLWYFLTLYDAVGRDYAWRDLHERDQAEVAAFIADKDVTLYTFLRDGWPHGFFLLDHRKAGVCELAYLGLVPEAVGQGLSNYLLRTAILTGWAREGVEMMQVNTCTLDHPRALAQYQRHGFAPVRRETRTRVLTRDWDPARFP